LPLPLPLSLLLHLSVLAVILSEAKDPEAFPQTTCRFHLSAVASAVGS
jgi:hypothetical protein